MRSECGGGGLPGRQGERKALAPFSTVEAQSQPTCEIVTRLRHQREVEVFRRSPPLWPFRPAFRGSGGWGGSLGSPWAWAHPPTRVWGALTGPRGVPSAHDLKILYLTPPFYIFTF